MYNSKDLFNYKNHINSKENFREQQVYKAFFLLHLGPKAHAKDWQTRPSNIPQIDALAEGKT